MLKSKFLFLESRTCENDDGTSRSERKGETQGNNEHSGNVHCKKLLLDTKNCLTFFFKIYNQFANQW